MNNLYLDISIVLMFYTPLSNISMLVLNPNEKSNIPNVASWHDVLISKKIALGFDGYIDSIVKVVKKQNEDGSQQYFEDITDFGNYIVKKANRNFSLELKQELLKVGGNMPITANAFAKLGCKVDCVGALGLPDIHHIFQQMSPNCTLYSYADPGMSTAIEFDNSKMMMAESTQINAADWSYIRDTIGLDQLRSVFSEKDLVGLLNWSEVAHSTGIWAGLLEEVLPFTRNGVQKPIGLFDLSDCSKKTRSQLLEALELLNGFSRYWNVVLSLNRNESTLVYEAMMGNPKETPAIGEIAAAIHDALGIGKVVVHHPAEACCYDADGLTRCSTPQLSNPKLLTGAGDNFNTGFCAAMLLEMNTAEALAMGHRLTTHYIAHGESPQFTNLF